jgi:elongation factor 2
VIAGGGEEHLDYSFEKLYTEYANCVLTKSSPVVIYNETVTEISHQICMTKSANKHNRIYMQAQPLHEELTRDIESNVINAK